MLVSPCPLCGVSPHQPHAPHQNWHPIAKAPKQGDILVTHKGSARMAVSHFNPELARPENGGWFMWGRNWKPTHWLWLPAPLLAFICHSHDPEGWAHHVFCQILPLGDVLAEFADWFDLAAAAAP